MTDGAAIVGWLSLFLFSLSLIPHDPVGSPEPGPWSFHGYIVSQVTSHIWLKKKILSTPQINFQKNYWADIFSTVKQTSGLMKRVMGAEGQSFHRLPIFKSYLPSNIYIYHNTFFYCSCSFKSHLRKKYLLHWNS